jgi:hypothetical protein
MATEETYSGLIDRLLAARSEPITPQLLADTQTGRGALDADGNPPPISVQWRAHIDAIDWALDLLVPAARQLVMLPEHLAGSGTVRKQEVERIVGRVPFERSARFRR